MEDLVFNLNRVSLNIGEITDTREHLIKFKNFKGFKDTLGIDFEDSSLHTEYPNLLGKYIIKGDVLQAELLDLKLLFPKLEIEYTGSLLNWNDLAVLTIDSSKSNYNPAVGIILNDLGIGTITSKGWYLSKSEAATITNIDNLFTDKVDVTDTKGIVSNNTYQTYPFTNFDELQYFSGITLEGNSSDTLRKSTFNYCTKLEYITFPPALTTLGNPSEYFIVGIFVGCTSLKLREDTLANITHIYGTNRSNGYYDAGGEGGLFRNCPSITSLNLPATLQHIGVESFAYCTGITEVKFGGSLDQWINLFSNIVALDWKSYKYGTNPVYYSHKLYVNTNQLVSDAITINTNNIYPYSIVGFDNVSKITFTGSFTTFPDYSICYCTNINEIVFPDTLLIFPADGLIEMPNTMIVTIKDSIQTININNNNNYNFHITKETPPTLSGTSNKTFIVYVGDGSSQSHDEEILSEYSTATNWSTLYNAGRIKTWWEHENN